MTPTDAEIDALARGLGPLMQPPAEDDIDLTLLQRYHAGTLDEAELPFVEGVLAADPAARAFVEELGDGPSAFRTAWAVKHGLEAVRPARSPARFAWPVVALAMAAAIALFVLRPLAATDAPPGYGVTLVRGAQMAARGSADDPPPERYRIDDAVTLTLALAPEGPPGDGLRARAFVEDPDGALRPAAAQGVLGGGGAWRLEAPSRALFGDRYGERRLHVAFAYDAAALDGLSGQPMPAEVAGAGVRLLSLTFDYAREGAAEEGAR